MSDEPRGRGRALLLLGALVLAAAFVFVVLPAWMSPPVATTAAPATPVDKGTPAPPPPSPPPVEREDPPPAPRAPALPDAPAPAPAPAQASAEASAAPDGFSEAVSLGLQALDSGAFKDAEAAFLRAEALAPGSPAVADGVKRARAGLLAQELEEHRQKAEAAEAREDWSAALREYDAALRLEPAVSFAVAGRARSLVRDAVDRRLQAYLDRPDRLAAEAVAREAAGLLEQTADLQAGPRLAAKRAALEKLLAGVGQPVAVRFLSDGQTQVTILRVGPLGAFKEKDLELRPGSYVVVGARAGFRDVRRTLVVPVGRSPSSVEVRCDEAL